MKTQLINPQQCESYYKRSRSWQSLPWLQDALQILTKKLKGLEIPAALQTCLAGLDASQMRQIIVTAASEAWTNKRVRVGYVVGLLAVPSWFSQLLFDINARDFSWYYVNWVFYINSIRLYVCVSFLLIGFFIAAPQKWKFRFWALPVVTFLVTQVYEISYYTSWKDFYWEYNPPAWWQVTAIIIVSVPALLISINYLLYRKHHLQDGNIARVFGMIKAPGIPAEEKINHLLKLVDESENFNARV
jgi:hypothetical protein